ncbi:hypothetical protein GCM10010216_19200 [Streptomyces flaveolus]|nr:hypothetical protein GCM10010216_19200 [Streptomyces flaveolus]
MARGVGERRQYASAESLSIREVAERTGLSVHALRCYEREGLLVGPVRRTSGGGGATPPPRQNDCIRSTPIVARRRTDSGARALGPDRLEQDQRQGVSRTGSPRC